MAYGALALIICPVRTWSCIMALYLRSVCINKGKDSSNSTQVRNGSAGNAHLSNSRSSGMASDTGKRSEVTSSEDDQDFMPSKAINELHNSLDPLHT